MRFVKCIVSFAVVLVLLSAVNAVQVYAQLSWYRYYALFKIVGNNFNVTVVYEFDDPIWKNVTHMFVDGRYIDIVCARSVCALSNTSIWYVVGGYLKVWFDDSDPEVPTACWQTLDENRKALNGGVFFAYPLLNAYIMYEGDVVPIEIRGYKVVKNNVNSGDTLGGTAKSFSYYVSLALMVLLIPSLYMMKEGYQRLKRRLFQSLSG